MSIRDEIMAEARRWVKTPYRHQARARGVGCDCVGLVWGVGEACGVLNVTPAQAHKFLAYSRTPNPRVMREALNQFLVEIPADDAQTGDLAWLAWRAEMPMHMAILAKYEDRFTLIHSSASTGMVVEHTLDAQWRARIEQWWRYPLIGEQDI